MFFPLVFHRIQSSSVHLAVSRAVVSMYGVEVVSASVPIWVGALRSPGLAFPLSEPLQAASAAAVSKIADRFLRVVFI